VTISTNIGVPEVKNDMMLIDIDKMSELLKRSQTIANALIGKRGSVGL
jgi:hypothetical protein